MEFIRAIFDHAHFIDIDHEWSLTDIDHIICCYFSFVNIHLSVRLFRIICFGVCATVGIGRLRCAWVVRTLFHMIVMLMKQLAWFEFSTLA